jgi:carboxymethylenebutenolidase
MGGGLALWLSTLSPDVKACVPFYGAIPWPDVQPDYSSSVAGYQGHYADHDDWAGPAVARKLESDLRAVGREATMHVYPSTDHAFFNDTRPGIYAPEASALAWQRTIEFLNRKL